MILHLPIALVTMQLSSKTLSPLSWMDGRAVHLYEEQASSKSSSTYESSQYAVAQEATDESSFLLHSAGLVKTLVNERLKVLRHNLAEINTQLQHRDLLSSSLQARLEKSITSLRNDESRLEWLSSINIRDPNGLSKMVTTQQIHEMHRSIVMEQQKAWQDKARLMEERRKLLERYHQYLQSLRVFSSDL